MPPNARTRLWLARRYRGWVPPHRILTFRRHGLRNMRQALRAP